MTLLATGVSIALAQIPFVGPFLAPIGYFAVYTLFTKYYADEKQHRAISAVRANTFYPDQDIPTGPRKLNQRAPSDRDWSDSMYSGIIGHPGGYYTIATGSTETDSYHAEIVVNPENHGREMNLLVILTLMLCFRLMIEI